MFSSTQFYRDEQQIETVRSERKHVDVFHEAETMEPTVGAL
jgi:hypothetical protein